MHNSKFSEWLKMGLGRAFLTVREQGSRDLILDACLHCNAIDPQSEGTHAAFMYDLVSELPDSAFFRAHVLDSLSDYQDNWDAVHRFAFAMFAATAGDARAKRGMYESFQPGPRFGEDIAAHFVRLDGLEGFRFAVSKLGKLEED